MQNVTFSKNWGWVSIERVVTLNGVVPTYVAPDVLAKAGRCGLREVTHGVTNLVLFLGWIWLH